MSFKSHLNWRWLIVIWNVLLFVVIQIYFVMNKSNLVAIVIVLVISLFLKVADEFPKLENYKKIAYILNLSLSLFLFGGVFFFWVADFGKKTKLSLDTFSYTVVLLPMFIFIMFFVYIIWNNINLREEIKTLQKENSGIKAELLRKYKEINGIKEAKISENYSDLSSKVDRLLHKSGLTKVKVLLRDNLKEYNGLIAIGNLLSLRKKDGVRFLEEYLESTDGALLDNKKVSYLVVPRESLFYLRDIFKNLKDKNLLPQIRIITIYPFVLIQGLLIIGNFTPEEKNIDVKSYFKYKANLREDEDMIDNGIFSNLEDSSVIKDYTISSKKQSLIFIFQSLVNNKYRNPDDYKISQHFSDFNDKEYEYKLIMRKNPMCFYCDLPPEKCKECPIYKISVTKNAKNLKEFFEESGKEYIGGIYEKYKS